MFDSLQASLDVRLIGSLDLLFDAPSSLPFDDDLYGSVIPVLSRAQAIAAGVLIDASPLAREIGFKDDVALTHRVYADCVGGYGDDDENTQLLYVLVPAIRALRAQSHRRLREIVFTARRVSPDQRECSIDLKIIAGPGDHGETVLTILSVDED
jgi:hypothetical protein